MADDESEKQMAMPSTEGESSNIVSEEPMIEIPLSSGSRIFKMKVSLADFVNCQSETSELIATKLLQETQTLQ